jgi:hypothetical protein
MPGMSWPSMLPSLYICLVLCIARDNVEWDQEQEEAALKAIEKQASLPIAAEEQGQLTNCPAAITPNPVCLQKS